MKKIHIDLNTLAGNAYALMALVQRLCHQAGLGEAAAQDIIHAMQKGAYDDLLNVLDEEFPGTFDFVGDPRPATTVLAVQTL